MFNPLHSILNQELFEKHLCNPRILKEINGAACPSYINYHLKSEVAACRDLWGVGKRWTSKWIQTMVKIQTKVYRVVSAS